jgi:hypothetical protein
MGTTQKGVTSTEKIDKNTQAQNQLIIKAMELPGCKIPVDQMDAEIAKVAGETGLSITVVEALGFAADVFPPKGEIEVFRFQRQKANPQLPEPDTTAKPKVSPGAVNKISLDGFRAKGIAEVRIDRLEYELAVAHLSQEGIRVQRGGSDIAFKAVASAGIKIEKRSTIGYDFANIQAVWRYFKNGPAALEKLQKQLALQQSHTNLLKKVLEAGVKFWEELNVTLPLEPPTLPGVGKKKDKKVPKGEPVSEPRQVIPPEAVPDNTLAKTLRVIPLAAVGEDETLPDLDTTMAKAIGGMLNAWDELERVTILRCRHDLTTIKRAKELLKRQLKR